MDFLDYQAYGLEDASTTDSLLPEPASRIKIQSKRSSTALVNKFQLPDLKKAGQGGETCTSANLQDRMQKYASLSLDLLSASEIPQYTGTESPTPSKGTLPRGNSLKQLLNSREDAANDADLLLSKKLSRVLDNYSSGPLSNIQLRKSFEILEENRERLNFKCDTIVRADYLGFLARKSLRSDLENELLRSHSTIIEEIQPIVRRVKRISEPVKSLQEVGNSILQHDSQKSANSTLDLKAISELRKGIEELNLKKQLLVVIRDKLTLTQIEEETLISAPVDNDLFEIVNKLMAIKKTASYLLSLENPTAGQTLLAQVNSKMERANKRIFNYLVNFFHDLHTTSKTFGERAFASDDNSLLTFQKSMVYLSNDLPLFNEVLKKIVKLRSQRVLNEFLSQFDFDSSKDSRPIIMSAHDPVRYLGDVLANVHSLIVDEADFMASMFKFQEIDIQGTPKTLLQENGEFLDGLGVKLLNESFKPSENSIRIRLEQIIRFEDNPLINFDICELLKLYKMMFIKYGIFPDSSLIQHLDSLTESAGNEIVNGILKMMDFSEQKPEGENGLLPPEWLTDYLNHLCKFFSKLEKGGSIGDSQSVVNASFIEKTVGHLVNGKMMDYHQVRFPLARRNRNEKISMLISETNCLDLVLTRITPYRNSIFQALGCEDIYGSIETQLSQAVKNITSLETAELLEKMGLALYSNLYNMIFPVDSVEDELDYDMYFPARDNPVMDIETIRSNVHQKLNDSLPEISNDIQENLIFNIISPKIADRISLGCMENLSKFYEVFRKSLQQLYSDSQDDVTAILNFTEQEFNTLIGLS
ncbi:LAFA_0E21066g1_1 [Lachancea sp. 'fantastica']|nr:LAFA_0E21066g1_1 [Lachancea sp. 'fantastica']